MRFRVSTTLLLFLSACASAPVSSSTTRASPFAPTPVPRARIQFVSARTDSRQSPIGKADLDQARALLFQARNDLEPHQWEALAGKLTSAERAFERFSQATKASGRTVEVIRGVEGLSQVDRARPGAKDLSRLGPMLVFLVLLYPSSTAGPETDRRPEWVDAQWEYEARLREVAEESRQLMEDLVVAVKAPTSWQTETNPATGRPYTSVEEYDRIPRHTHQTCRNSRLDELEAQKTLLRKAVPPFDPKAPRSTNKKKWGEVPCSRIMLRLEAMKKVLEKRWEIQKECFGGQPDPGHHTTMAELEQGIASLKKLEATNCAPGHPMADK